METKPSDQAKGQIAVKESLLTAVRVAEIIVLIKEVLGLAAKAHAAVIAQYPTAVDTAEKIVAGAIKVLGLSFLHAQATDRPLRVEDISAAFHAAINAPARQERVFVALSQKFAELERDTYELPDEIIEGLTRAIATSSSDDEFDQMLRATLLKFQLELNLAQADLPPVAVPPVTGRARG
ncbi:hypothetical protein [Luteimonas sp. FCS-9]|uniref:hypothetical protein n=1 Tax=Luteimonas sp. FCS-9 TaxID=1547516 RepID=UPI000A3FFBDD|nr:hypothetical protein [Luteimonas sp. FCS-9]